VTWPDRKDAKAPSLAARPAQSLARDALLFGPYHPRCKLICGLTPCPLFFSPSLQEKKCKRLPDTLCFVPGQNAPLRFL